MEEETIFQENLERLEAGEALEAFVADLTPEQASLLNLVSQIQMVSQFTRDPAIVAAQHQQVVSLWNQKK